MRRGSFGRSVARAAASGGGRAYRARAPIGWYASVVLIVVAGVGLVAYSRYERLHPVIVGPTASDNWQAAFSADICGTVAKALPANPNLGSVGIRTFGNGLIDINPGAASTPSAFEGRNATLGKFASSYPGFTLTPTSIQLPGKGQRLWKDGDRCTSSAGPLDGPAKLVVKVWSSPSSPGRLFGGDPTKLHLENGQMITVAFVPAGSAIPEPPSRTALLQALGLSSSTSPATSSTTPPTSSTTPATSSTTPATSSTAPATTSKGARSGPTGTTSAKSAKSQR